MGKTLFQDNAEFRREFLRDKRLYRVHVLFRRSRINVFRRYRGLATHRRFLVLILGLGRGLPDIICIDLGRTAFHYQHRKHVHLVEHGSGIDVS